MTLELFYHPFSRAAGTLWMLEEVGQPYELRFLDMQKGEHKREDILAMNAMGKLPILKDGELIVTESAAIGLYLADRYSAGTLAPALDDPARGTYFRWSLFAPSVIEPGCYAKGANWEFREGSAGWGNYEVMLGAIAGALEGREFLLGDRFTMADIILGGTLRYMLQFKMLDSRPIFEDYVKRLNERPAYARATAKNQERITSHGLAAK